MAAAADQAGEVLGALRHAWDRYTSSRFTLPGDEPQEPRDHLWASGIRDCTRRMALDMLHPHVGRDFDLAAMERMLFGREREEALKARLIHVGQRCDPPFEIVESQAGFSIVDQGVKLVTGRVDGRLYFGRGKAKPIFEVKAGRSVERIQTVDDFDHSPWTRHMPDQLLLYLYAKSEPWGFFALDTPGNPRFIPFILEDHLDRVTETLERARLAIDARHERQPLPPYHDDVSICRRCPHLGVTCAPPIDYTGVQVLEDPEIEQLLADRQAVADAARKFKRLDKRVKDLLGRQFEELLVGSFIVRGKRQKKTWTEIPFPALGLLLETLRRALPKLSKKQRDAAGPLLEQVADDLQRQFKKSDPKGGFRVYIDKIGEEGSEDDDGDD